MKTGSTRASYPLPRRMPEHANRRPANETKYRIAISDHGRAIVNDNPTTAVTWTLMRRECYPDDFWFIVRNNAEYPVFVVSTGCGIGSNSGIPNATLTLNPNQAARVFFDGAHWQYILGQSGQSNRIGNALYALGYGGATYERYVTISGTATNGNVVGFDYTSVTPSFTRQFRHTINTANPDPFFSAVVDLATQFRKDAVVRANLTPDVADEAYYQLNSSGNWEVYFNEYYPFRNGNTVGCVAFTSGGATATVTTSAGASIIGNRSGLILGGSFPQKVPSNGDGLGGIFWLGDYVRKSDGTTAPMPTKSNVPWYAAILVGINDATELGGVSSDMNIYTGAHQQGNIYLNSGAVKIDTPTFIVGAGSSSVSGACVIHDDANENLVLTGASSLASGVTIASVNDANNALQPLELNASLIYTDDLVEFANTTASTSPTTGAFKVAGGLGCNGNFHAITVAAVSAVTAVVAVKCTGAGGRTFDWMSGTAGTLRLFDETASADRITVSSAGLLRFHAYGAGTLTTDASGNVTATSDIADKIDRGAFHRSIDDLRRIGGPNLFTWKTEVDEHPDAVNAGFYAHKVERGIPEAVGHNPDGKKTFNRDAMIAALLNAALDMDEQIKSLKQEIAAMRLQ